MFIFKATPTLVFHSTAHFMHGSMVQKDTTE